MKGVHLTIDPPEAARPPVYERLTRGRDDLQNVRIVDWDVATPPAAFLLQFEGAYDQFAADLDAEETVRDYDIIPLSDRECLCYLTGETADARGLFEHLTQGSLLTVAPVRCHDDGRCTVTLVGTEADLESAVEGLPPSVGVTVEVLASE